MAVTRTGGTSSNFASATTSPQSIAFTLPGGSDYLVAMVSIYIDGSDISALTWKPDSGNADADQAMSLIGKHIAGNPGSVEIWGLANPTATVTGSVVQHSLDVASKRIMGIHSLSGVGSVGTFVGSNASGTGPSVAPASVVDGRVFDVLFVQNSTTSRTAHGSQTERWDTNTTGGLNNLGAGGSEEAGAAGTVTMSWTLGTSSNYTIGAVSFNPPTPSLIYRPPRQIIRL